jgi:hypothetical protein
MELFIAGATSVFGLKKIEQAFNFLGYEVHFVEATFMKSYATIEEEVAVNYVDFLPENSVILPLSEYWISYCFTHGCKNISQKALQASRSKKLLHSYIQEAGFSNLIWYKTPSDAIDALENDKKVLIKPEGLHSGFGVEVLDKSRIPFLEQQIEKTLRLKTNTMKLMKVENKGYMLCEYVEGTEYSADCFYYQGRISLVRLCRKEIILINNKPCTAVYQLTEPTEQITKALFGWVETLFEKDNLSFAQFDFIITPENSIIPIDFACRVGGGLTELLSQTGTNPYADSIKGEYSINHHQGVLTQFNYLPIKTGYIVNDNYPLLPGYQKVWKHKGDHVTCNPSSVGSRAALVITPWKTNTVSQETLNSLLLDEQWISSNKIL